MCLGKSGECVDITTYRDSATYESVLLCLSCGGYRYIHREDCDK